MHRRLLALGTTLALSAASLALTSSPAPAAPADDGPLDVYTARVAPEVLAELEGEGVDVTAIQPRGSKLELDLVLDADEADRLRAAGVKVRLKKIKGGKTVRQFAEAQAASGYDVWRSYDEKGGFEDQLREAARRNPQLVKLVRLGTTYQGRPILAAKLTQGARGQADGSRPAVLFSSTQHAREWIAAEVNRRLMNHVIDRWRANDKEIRQLLRTRELWFVLVANPDGYQYTFDNERLWRKNLRDNDDDGVITSADGVDPNRNFDSHWGYDEEGSSSIPSSATYRGPGPASEPETRAMQGLLDRIGFAFQVNYHSFGEWLLYAEGWQIGTPTADDPIYYAMSGNLDDPAIEGYHPGLSSDVLYVTNGETTDYAHAEAGTLAWTPELSEGCDGCGFVFPDDEDLVQAEFERNLPFALSVVRSADDPANPETVTGLETEPFSFDTEDAYKSGLPLANLRFTESYGSPQPVAVLAQRSLGPVTLKWRVNGGATQSAAASEWTGEDYTPAGVHYHQVRADVTGAQPGDSVEVWFEGGGETSESFTYEVVSDTGSDVLVVAAEDYTGASPVQSGGPNYLDYYLEALDANGVDADVYDVDANGRTAPDHLGVLSHYDGVIWYTGDDIVTREAGRGGGNADRLAMDEILEMREFINEGGRVAYTGDWAAEQYTLNVGYQLYDPKDEIACQSPPPGTDPRRCLGLPGSGDFTNDVLQYTFGGYNTVAGDGFADDGTVYDVAGVDTPFDGETWGLNGGDGAQNQGLTASFLATSGILPVTEFPQFESWPAARYDRPGGPFAPHTGDQFVYSGIADVSYKRLTQTVDVPAGGGSLSFWTSYDTEADWDYLFVEARTPGGDDWTTLPDANGHTSTDTGQSCPAGWIDGLHPQLGSYQTDNGDGTCDPTGSSGSWNAASGPSGGWQEWSVDLSAYAGQSVEISIAYVSDWATQGLGVFVDDVTLPDGTSTSFEDDLGGWTVSGPPPGSAPNSNDWARTDANGFPVGAVIATPDTLLMGFGFEAISTEAERTAVMERIVQHLLG